MTEKSTTARAVQHSERRSRGAGCGLPRGDSCGPRAAARRRRARPRSEPRSRRSWRSPRAAAAAPRPAATTSTATHAAVTIRVPPAATCSTAWRGTMIRPRRPVGRSRADHAVTASRSRSIRNWSGTSIATRGTKRAASIASSRNTAHTIWADVSVSAASVVRRKTSDPDDRPDPQPLLGMSVERRARRPRSARRRAHEMPRIVGSRAGSGSQASAKPAAPPKAGAASTRWAASGPRGTALTKAAPMSRPIATSRRCRRAVRGQRAGQDRGGRGDGEPDHRERARRRAAGGPRPLATARPAAAGRSPGRAHQHRPRAHPGVARA